MKEYRVVYNYRGFTIEAGQNGWIPSKEIAEKILNNKQKYDFYSDRVLFLEERETETPQPNMYFRIYNGKKVYNKELYYFDALEIGDYVDKEIIDDYINMLPPTYLSYNLFQMGEPYTQREDVISGSGRWRNTYGTFERVSNDIWKYCGDCFYLENEQR